MKIDDRVRREALLRILDARLRELHGLISHDELVAAWRQTGLRDSDLPPAIADLFRLGGWTLETYAGERRYRLVVATIEQLGRPPGTLDELVAQVMARAELFRVGRRRRSAHPGHGRRAMDATANVTSTS